MTKPKGNGNFLDCDECFGHGLKHDADPRCIYGCGKFMTYPIIPEKEEYIEMLDKSTDASTMPNMPSTYPINEHTDQHFTRTPTIANPSFSTKFKSWKGILGVGILLIVCVAILIYVLYQKQYKPQKKVIRFNWSKSTSTIETQE